MASAPRQASSSSIPSPRDFSTLADQEPATVEESPETHDLISILRQAAASGSRPPESILDALADAARVLSGADGTALALDTDGIIVCRACSGDVALQLGAPINTTSGISGECLRLGTVMVCHDAMTDARVDGEVCRSMGIRSIAVVPVRGPSSVAGILEAFSARPNAFDGDAITSLRELAGIAETAYSREAPQYGIAARPMAEIARPATIRSTPQLAAEEVLDSLSQPGRNRVWIVAGIAVALLLIVGVAWWSWQVPADEVAGSGRSVRAASAEPAHPAPAHEMVPKPGPGVPTNRAVRSRPEIVQNAAEVKPIELSPETAAGTASGTPDTVEVRTTAAANESSAAVEPPSVSLAPPADPEALTALSSVTAQMPAALRVSQGVVEAALIHRVDPIYPLQARTLRLAGKVTLSAKIAADGSVREVAVVGGSPILATAAKAAVRQWRYRPATLNGTAIEVQKEIIVLFDQP